VSGQQHAPAALYPRERPGTHCTGGWVGPRAGLGGLVCLYLIQIHISEPIWTKLCTHLSPWSGRDRRVCMVRKCLTFSTFLTFVGSWCRILGTKWLQARVIRDNVISVILAGVSATSRKWRCSRRQFCVSDQIFALL